MGETIKPIFGEYYVSNEGYIYSKVRKREAKLKPRINNRGYGRVVLTLPNGTKKHFLIHRLVASAFCDNTMRKPIVNHLNGERMDNRAANLEWCTYSENQRHARKHGRFLMTEWKNKGKECLTASCIRKAYAHGICSYHYQKQRKSKC